MLIVQDVGNYEEPSDEELEKHVRRSPEKMDEEIPSDQESVDSNYSLYEVGIENAWVTQIGFCRSLLTRSDDMN